jgi:hypothetical protein
MIPDLWKGRITRCSTPPLLLNTLKDRCVEGSTEPRIDALNFIARIIISTRPSQSTFPSAYSSMQLRLSEGCLTKFCFLIGQFSGLGDVPNVGRIVKNQLISSVLNWIDLTKFSVNRSNQDSEANESFRLTRDGELSN